MFPVLRLLDRFRGDQRGNIAVIFAIACVPLISGIGCAIDYSEAVRIKSKLQSAADAAAVAAISQNSAGWKAASLMTTNGEVKAAETDAKNIFNGNITASTSLFKNQTVTATVTKAGPALTSAVSFSADVPVTFMKVVGFSKVTVSGSSSASSSLPLYLDFYLTLDVSGSMGLPSTTAEQARLNAVNPDNFGQYPTGCTLACHFAVQNVCSDTGSNNQKYPTNSYCMGYAFTRVSQTALNNLLHVRATKQGVSNSTALGFPDSMIPGMPNSLNTDPTYGITPVSSCSTDGTDACIQLRADAVGYAVNQLFMMANDPRIEVIPNQFRIGLYPFIQHLYAYFPLTSAINGSPTNSSTINYAAANLASQLDTNTNSNLGSGGTHIDTALSDLNNLILSVGDGSAANNTLPYVFLVTDGAQDPPDQSAEPVRRLGRQQPRHRDCLGYFIALRATEKPRHQGLGPLYPLRADCESKLEFCRRRGRRRE
jgi:Flp pilus assembly protein TadG